MKLLPLTSAQASFVEVEIIGRYIDDDDDERVAAVMGVIADHFERTRATGTPGLAVTDAELLRGLILDVINDIDDAIEAGRSEEQGYGDARAARGLHRTGTALLKKIRGSSFSGLEGVDVAQTISDQIGSRAFMMLGASNLLGDDTSLTFKIGRNAQGVTHIRVQLDPDDTYTMQFMRIGRAPRFEKKIVSEASGIYADQLRELIERRTGMYTSL